jgi:hypothetical protein
MVGEAKGVEGYEEHTHVLIFGERGARIVQHGDHAQTYLSQFRAAEACMSNYKTWTLIGHMGLPTDLQQVIGILFPTLAGRIRRSMACCIIATMRHIVVSRPTMESLTALASPIACYNYATYLEGDSAAGYQTCLSFVWYSQPYCKTSVEL